MRRLSAVLVTLVLAAGLSAAQEKITGSCDRACLEGMVNQYLAAMVAHDASKAPFAKNAVFTENADSETDGQGRYSNRKEKNRQFPLAMGNWQLILVFFSKGFLLNDESIAGCKPSTVCAR
jgi:hypothetical protein